MKVIRIEKEHWAALSEGAHRIVFKENKPCEMDRIDFALSVEENDDSLISYVTCRENDRDTVYMQYGGSFPGARGTPKSLHAFLAIVRWFKESGYKRVWCLVENTNKAMLKLAMRAGFLITGIRVYKGNVLLEHGLEFCE